MEFVVQQAQDIVEQIGAIVKQNINMMDERGYIIASTDASRIGNFHEGAKKIIDEQLAELYVTPAMETGQMRRGINLPLEHEGKIIGVIGITGGYEQVIGYGQVVKKMTEILIRERVREDEKRLDLRVTSRFLEEWVLGNGILRPELLAERGKLLGIDIHWPRRVMVLSLDRVEDYIDTLEGQEFIEQIENAVLHIVQQQPQALVLRNAARQILLLPAMADGRLLALAESLYTQVGREFHQPLRIGVDGVSGNTHEAYVQADKAWRTAAVMKRNIMIYSHLDLEMFLNEISPGTKFDYLEKIFRAYAPEERAQVMELLEAYFAADGSLAGTAQRLYLHKNTLQYKLRRLARLTGYDVRQPRYAAVFYMALLFYREGRNISVPKDENKA